MDPAPLLVGLPPPTPRATCTLANWSPPTKPTDRALLRKELSARADRLSRKPVDAHKGRYLTNALNGEPLAPKGERNTATLIVSGILAYAAPSAPEDDLFSILEPSLEKMRALGSKLSEEKVRRMLNSAMHAKARADASIQEATRRAERKMAEMVSSLTSY